MWARAKPSGLAGKLVSVVSRDPEGPDAKQSGRYSVKTFGVKQAAQRTLAAAQGWVPPEADITSPEWFDQLDPGKSSFAVNGYVSARTGYTCRVGDPP